MSQVSLSLFFPSARPGLHHHKRTYFKGQLLTAIFCLVQLGFIIVSYILRSPTCFTDIVNLSFVSNSYYALLYPNGGGRLLLWLLNHVVKYGLFCLLLIQPWKLSNSLKALIWCETMKN